MRFRIIGHGLGRLADISCDCATGDAFGSGALTGRHPAYDGTPSCSYGGPNWGLLQRTPSGYALTPTGEAVLGNAERAEAEVLAAERAITGRDVALEGVVRLTTVDTLAARIVAPALAALQKRHPGIVVELVPDTRSLSLSKREADIALRMTRFEGHEVATRRVGAVSMGLYA